MLKSHFKSLTALVGTLILAFSAWALPPEFDKTYFDVGKPQNSKELVNDKYLDKVIKPDPVIFLGSFGVYFATQNEFKVQKATESIAITGWTKLMGVPDEVFQEITDEAAAYAEKKWGEVYGTFIPESEVSKHEKWADLESKIKPEELRVETKRGLNDAAPVGGTHYKKFFRGGVPPKAMTTMKGYIPFYKIQLQNKFTNVHIGYGINFSVVSSGGFEHGKDEIKVSLGVEPFLTGAGGATIGNTKMKASGTSVKKNAAMLDSSWVKNWVKKEGPVWEIEADPVKFKEATLKILTTMIDLETDRAKAVKAED